jgi:hypothetical protein
MAEAFAQLRRIHKALELLGAAERLPLPAALAAERSALRGLFHPDADWTPETLAGFDLAGAERRLRAFVQALRDHV